MKTLYWLFFLGFIKFTFWPDANLLGWMLIAVAIDFLVGFMKAVFLNQKRTSAALRKTLVKFLQYGGAIAAALILQNALFDKKDERLTGLLQYTTDVIVIFIIYVELVSIFENLIEIDPENFMSRYFFKPVHNVLTLNIQNLFKHKLK
ncbi:MAG: phage holin family protein [Chitinophagaceae bacterium]|nr:phage holin family protein [Chitinophagaceae bacterium]